MAPEALEQLLTDRALGQLSPEVAALLEAYLAHHPPAAQEAQDLTQVVALARRAVGTVSSRPLPALDVRRGKTVVRRRQLWRMAAVGIGMAACLALGFWMAQIAGRGGNSPGPGPAIAEIPAPMGRPQPAAANAFWSLQRLEGLARPNAAVHGQKEMVETTLKRFGSIGG